jgi:flagellar M-ring protein FliF
MSKFPEIRQVRVHLNIPKESLFLDDAREPAASVVVNLYPGRSLSQTQILGIVNLVASSVEGLKTKNVSVVDTAGGLLYKQEDDSGAAVLSATQVEQRKAIEKSLADRVTSMLERVIGPNKAVTRVSAELELNQVSTTEETFNPDLVVIRSEQRLTEKTTGPSSATGGPAGTPYILGTDEAEGGASQAQELQDRTEETINYEIARTTRKTIIPGGTIKRLSVAVIVDGNYEVRAEGEKTIKAYIPRAEAELTRLENLVRHAIGSDEERGDTVAVSSFQFYIPEEEKEPFSGGQWASYLRQAARPAINVFLIFLFFLFVVRPLIGWIRREARVTVQQRAEVQLPGAPAPALPGGAIAPEKPLPERIREMTSKDPDKVAELIKAWIAEV